MLAGSVSVLLLALVATIVTLADSRRLTAFSRPLSVALLLGAATALVIGWARPAPWLLATLLDLMPIAIWSFAVARYLLTARAVPESGSRTPAGRRRRRCGRLARV